MASEELVPVFRLLCIQMAVRGPADDVNAPEIDNGCRRLPFCRGLCVEPVRKMQKCDR